MSRLSTIRDDIHALGSSAIPRALYESSKLAGGHALLFRRTATQRPLRSALGLPQIDIDSAAAHAALKDAQLICNVGLLAFGERFPVESAEDWIKDPRTGQQWPQDNWWKIDIRSADRMADVKWTWELGRHRDLVVLARAHYLDADYPRWLNELTRLLELWLAANPREASIHWYSNLEIALRLIAWDQVIALAGSDLSADITSEMESHVAQSQRHLLRDLPYTVSSMKNNHLLGDALGIQLSYAMTGRTRSARGVRIADRLWNAQLSRHMHEDGSMIEDSLSYHRFVLEMFCVRRMLGDQSPRLTRDLRNAAQHLVELGVMDGAVPQFGDWDEGRVLTSSTDPLDVANSTALGLALAGEPIEEEWFQRFDLLSWYAPVATSENTSRKEPEIRAATVGRFSRATKANWKIWLKSGSGASHGHADLGHISAQRDGEWILGDPGTGTYNGPLNIRNGFRTSAGHNVLRIAGGDQLGPHRAFRWQRAPWSAVGTPLTVGAESETAPVLWGANDAFSYLPGVGRSVRAVIVGRHGLVVVDWTETDGSVDCELTIPLGEGVNPDTIDFRTSLGSWSESEGQDQPWSGWHSRTYGSWVPAKWIITSGSTYGVTWWSVGATSQIDVSGNSVSVGTQKLELEWHAESVALALTDDLGNTVTGVIRSAQK